MRIKVTKMLTIDELSQERRDQEIENRRNSDINYDWWESTIEDFCETTAQEKGFDVDPHTVMFEFHCQGSGASFAAGVDEEKILKILDPDAKQWPAVHLIIDEITLEINREGRNSHDGTMDVNVVNYNEDYNEDEGEDDLAMTIAVAQVDMPVDDQVEAFGAAVLEEARELARKLHYILNEEYDDMQTDEYILEDLRANEVEFEEGEVTVDYDPKDDRRLTEFIEVEENDMDSQD